jgi:adenylate kinase family enzyme
VSEVIEQHRIWLIGDSGSGKSTWARRISNALDIPFVELDGIFHQPQWTGLDSAEFRRRVVEITDGDAWIIDGNYSAVRDVMFERSTHIVAFDLPRHVVVRQVVRRTLSRSRHREVLWNGNVEPRWSFLRWDPEKSVIRWSYTSWPVLHERIKWFALVARGRNITYLHAHSHRELGELLATTFGRQF